MVVRSLPLKTEKRESVIKLFFCHNKNILMFHNKLFVTLNLFGSEFIFLLVMTTLFTFLRLRFLIFDKGSREALFMNLSDVT